MGDSHALRTQPLIYIIGLPDSYRGTGLERSLVGRGLRYERVDGVRVSEATALDVDQVGAKTLLRRELTPGEIGCALAHGHVYTRFLASDEAWCVVLEDDAHLGDFNRGQIEVLDETLSLTAPIIVSLYVKPGFGVVERIPTNTPLLQTVTPPTTTTAYALNRDAARILLNAGAPISHVADWPVRSEVACRFMVTDDDWFTPSNDASTIEGRPPETPAGLSAAIARRLGSVLHWRWFRNRALYGAYGNYVMHEFVRGIAFRRARRNASRTVVSPWYLTALSRAIRR